jgi:carboxypeptidase family protein
MNYLRLGKFPSIHGKKVRQLSRAGVVVFLFCLPLFSQTSQGTIQGGVFDQSGGAIAGATVTVLDVARGVTRVLTTDSAGQYVANGLTPGTYTVRAEAKGFRNVEHSGVLLEVGQNIRVDLVVQPGEQTQTITVTGEIPAVDTTDAVLGGTVSNQSINALPLNGRNFERLLELRPGAVADVGAGTGSSSTNGRRDRSDMLRVEGIAEISSSSQGSLLNANYRGGDTASLLPIDAIQEFSSTQNPKAEYGWKDGSIVNVGVKSGTNSIHGTAYAFGRNASATDAANYFTGAVTPATLEQFGATAGGPILKDKLFWFVNYEGLRVNVGDVATLSMPSSVAGLGPRNSMVDACLALGGKINPLSAQLAGLTHNLNGATGDCAVAQASSTVENVFPYVNSATSNIIVPPIPSNIPLNNGLFKADYALGPHHHLNGMYYVSKSQNLTTGTGTVLPQWATGANNDSQQYDGNWTWTPNSTWVNDFRLGYVFIHDSTFTPDQNMLAGNPWPNGYGMNTGVTNPLYGGFPTITFTSFTGVLGCNCRTGIRGPQGDVDLVENVSYLRGKHSFKFGFEYLDVIFDGNAYPGVQGAANFPDLQSFLQGIPDKGSIFLGNADQNTRMHWYGGFIQDDWRIKPRITLNLGLRYEYYASPVERQNYLGNFDPNVNPATTPAVLQFGPGAPLSQEFKPQWGTLSPRVGVAWDVQGNGKTVVRASGGLSTTATILDAFIQSVPFGANFPSVGAAVPPGTNTSGTALNAHSPARYTTNSIQNWNLTGAPVFTTGNQTINGVTYTGPTCAPAAAPFNGTPCQTSSVNPNFRQPRAAEWDLDIQRAITNNLTLDVAYVGNHGWDESTIVDLNEPPIGTGYTTAVTAKCITTPNTANCKPSTAAERNASQYGNTFPYLSQIEQQTYGDTARYNALQVTLQGRTYHGLSFLAAYTYAHALSELDTQSGSSKETVATDKNNLRLNYGNSAYDLRHRFTFSPTYLIPGMKSPGQMLEGWSVNGIVTLQGGLPWNPSDLTSNDLTGTGENKNTQVGNGSDQYWNYTGPASAFKSGANPIPCFGNLAGCTPFASAPTQLAACTTAAEAPYEGNATLQGLALASLTNLGCYMQGGGILTPPAYGTVGDAGRGFFRGPNYYNVDFSIAKLWKLKERYTAQFRIEFFNLFNRADFAVPGIATPQSDPSTGITGGFGYAQNTPDLNNAVLGSGGPRHIQFGLKLTF